MTIREALTRGTTILKEANIEAPAVDAGVMLCYVMNCDRTWLYTHSHDALDKLAGEKYSFVLSRRCAGMPVQYITGKQEFMGLEFHVERGVLIPRADTEILVEAVIELGKIKKHPLRILEIGTGSGCIAVSAAYYLESSFVVAADISERALEIARINAIKHGVGKRIEFIKSNLFDKLDLHGFDCIVSNPPYIRCDEIPGLQLEVRDFEPKQALDGGVDGLYFYKAITRQAPLYLKDEGVLAYEVGIHQACKVSQILKGSFSDIKIRKDLAGIDRVVMGKVKKVI